jgi:hypothetical protein
LDRSENHRLILCSFREPGRVGFPYASEIKRCHALQGYVPPSIALVHGSENHLFELLHKVCRAAHPEWAAVEHMGIDHGGAHILVAQELLDGTDVLPPFQ